MGARRPCRVGDSRKSVCHVSSSPLPSLRHGARTPPRSSRDVRAPGLDRIEAWQGVHAHRRPDLRRRRRRCVLIARPTLILRSPPETNIDSNAHPPVPPVYTHVLPRVANAHRRLLRRCHASRPREPHAPGRARHRRPRRGWGKPVPAGRRQRHLGYPQHGLRGPRAASRRQERARGGFLTEGRTRFQGEGVPRAAGLLRRAQRGRGGPSQADVRQVSEPIGERDELKKARARALDLHDGRSQTPPVFRWKRAAPMRRRATARKLCEREKTMKKRMKRRTRTSYGVTVYA